MSFVTHSFLVLLISFSALSVRAQSECKYLFPEPGWEGYHQIFSELEQLAALPSGEEEAFRRWFDETHESANAFLEDKLKLTTGLKNFFDGIHHLRDVLLVHMYLAGKRPTYHENKMHYDEKIQSVLGKYIEDGDFQSSVYPHLEYLFLISGRAPSSLDLTSCRSEIEIAKKIFDFYKMPGQEVWHQQTYERHRDYVRKTHQATPALRIEEDVLRVLAHSRAGIRNSTDELGPDLADLVKQVDEFYQTAYQKIFKRRAPVDLRSTLRFTEKISLSSSADHVRNRIYLNSKSAAQNPEYVLAEGIHEQLQLDFKGFMRREDLREALVEYIREEMHVVMYPSVFRFTDLVQSRIRGREALKVIFDFVPHSSEAFLDYFASGDDFALKEFLRAHLTKEIRAKFFSSRQQRAPSHTALLLGELDSFMKDL